MLVVLILLFFISVIIIGGERGVISLMTLFGNALIGVISMFLLGQGIYPIPILIISCTLFTMVTIFYQNGYKLKTFVTFLSTLIISLLISSVIYYICIRAHITGMNEIALYEDDASFLSSEVNLNMLSILLVSMIWGELGAVIDTSMSISSAMNEIIQNNREISKRQLFKSAMTMGKDIIGTTINTLLFVSFGESIMVILYYIRFGYSFEQLMNSKSFFQEMSVILFNCIGCIGIIPLTAVIFIFCSNSSKITSYFQSKENE